MNLDDFYHGTSVDASLPKALGLSLGNGLYLSFVFFSL
jgi:hypothetical protein